jgi:hypothetical protein
LDRQRVKVASSLLLTEGLRSHVDFTVRLTVHRFFMLHSYKQTIIKCNNLVIQYKEHLLCTVVYLTIFMLLRTLRLVGIKTFKPTEERGGWL